MMRALALIGGLVLWATTAWAGPPSAEQAPGPVQAAWEYPPEEEFLLGNHPPSGFIFYRGLGAECSHFMLIGLLWPVLPSLLERRSTPLSPQTSPAKSAMNSLPTLRSAIRISVPSA